MALLHSRPLFTREYDEADEFVAEPGSAYLYGVTTEPRSQVALDMRRRHPHVNFVEIRETESFSFETDCRGFEHVLVRRRKRLDDFVRSIEGDPIYLDITGLGHGTWAPLVRVCLEQARVLRVIYLEPATYNVATSPEAADIYDLSEVIRGIAPVPLFATLSEAPAAQTCFVPLLGFEGPRLSNMINDLEPVPNLIYPVIGVPGFRLHYPFEAYIGNALPLERSKAWRNLRYARSNCPFSLFYVLDDLARRFPDHLLKVGLIGTKPHALGAFLFAIAHGERVEIVYDHVKRKLGRTRGAARCLIYGASDFLPPERLPRS